MPCRSQHNAYSALIEGYEGIPKQVLASIAASFAIRLNDEVIDDHVDTMIREEWRALYRNGIVTQRPKAARGKPVL